MYGLDMINTSVLGALGCDMNTFLRYFPAAETMYSLLVALAIGLILLGWVWNLFKNYGLGLGVDAEDPVKLTAKAILFIVLAYYADEIVNIALTIGGTPYAWILSSELPSLDFASFNSVLLTIIGVCANGGVALIVLILTLILAWNYIMELMMYPFLTMNDHTEIVYSHLLDDGRVKIYVEKPDEHDGFHHAVCFLPGCRWEDIVGFSDAEIQEYQKVIESSAEQIMRLAASGKG